MFIRESSKNISKVCNGLFKDPKHLEELFVDLTDVKISTKMERGFVGHMGICLVKSTYFCNRF